MHPTQTYCCPVAGVLDLKRAQEWVVTTKLGSSDKRPGTAPHAFRACKLFPAEALMALFVLSAAMYALATFQRLGLSAYLALQGKDRGSRFVSVNLRPHGIVSMFRQRVGAVKLQKHPDCHIHDDDVHHHLMTMTAAPLHAGLVFLAFGFNMVDCGGLLGGRLDLDLGAVVGKAHAELPVSVSAPIYNKRTHTVSVTM